MTVFLATAHNGKLDFGSDINQARLHDFLVKNEGKTLRVELPKTTRSLSQNSLLWFYYGIIEQETGNDANELHEYFKRAFLPPKFITVMGKELKIPKSTTELTKAEFGEFLERICAETGVPIPDAKLAGFITNY